VSYLYLGLTILFTVYGQLVLKWQIGRYGSLPGGLIPNLLFLIHLYCNPWILSAFFAGFLASLCWMATMTKLDLGYAYPFMSLAFVLVTIFSVTVLGESLGWGRAVGTAVVVFGLWIIAR
jgi:multidrug transporter EmrE-like cation transporter